MYVTSRLVMAVFYECSNPAVGEHTFMKCGITSFHQNVLTVVNFGVIWILTTSFRDKEYSR
jgi:hypothetical protein